MAKLTKLPALRWAVPALVTAAVIGGGALVGTLTASADPKLPTRSAAQLLVDLQNARLDALSGTVVQRADLGLPGLPGVSARSSELSSLVSGKHTLRVWYAGPDQIRVALLGRLGESDIIVNKQDLWLWSSKGMTYAHKRLPTTDSTAKAGDQTRGWLGSLSAPPLTPQQMADAALAAIEPSTVVSTAGSAKVAGRDAYEMVLAPRDNASLVGQVRFAIDAKEYVPLRVQVYAKGGGEPALEVAFTEINFDRPDPEQFAFTPPPGSKEAKVPSFTHTGMTMPTDVRFVGSGWTTVVAGKLPAGIAGEHGPAAVLGAFSRMLPKVDGDWGSGHLLSGKLFSVLIADDGRVLAGLVSPERLYEAAADPAAKVTTE